jgi:hypothetical protein
LNSDRIKKIEAEIAKIKEKMSTDAARLRELERKKTELENAGIIALVRDMDILPDELTAFIQAFKQKSNDGETAPPLPDVSADTLPPSDGDTIKNETEDTE